MSGLNMFDAVDDSQYPPAGPGVCFAGYVDGSIGDQPDYGWLVKNRPGSPILSIALFPGGSAQCLDVENGAATPQSAAGWYERQRARGVSRPCLYASVDNMESEVVPVITAAGVNRKSVRLWTAHYGVGEHICGPSSCKLLSIAADGTQWTPNAVIDGKARDLDQSLLDAGFFDIPSPPPPPGWTYGPPRDLRATAGHASVRLEWEPPAGAPEPPDRYHVYVYAGSECSRATLVKSYPRGTAATSWEGGSLDRGRHYTAHVVAAGPGGSRVKPYCYASTAFTTG